MNHLVYGTGKKLRTISLDDEAKLSKYYQSKMQKLCKELARAFGFKPKVQGTALTFFKRFYLGCSALDHDPKNIMLTCIYLACKVSIQHQMYPLMSSPHWMLQVPQVDLAGCADAASM